MTLEQDSAMPRLQREAPSKSRRLLLAAILCVVTLVGTECQTGMASICFIDKCKYHRIKWKGYIFCSVNLSVVFHDASMVSMFYYFSEFLSASCLLLRLNMIISQLPTVWQKRSRNIKYGSIFDRQSHRGVLNNYNVVVVRWLLSFQLLWMLLSTNQHSRRRRLPTNTRPGTPCREAELSSAIYLSIPRMRGGPSTCSGPSRLRR